MRTSNLFSGTLVLRQWSGLLAMQTQPALIYENKVLELLDDIIDVSARPMIILEGGHYSPVTGADEFSIAPLRAALGVGEHLIEHFGKRFRLVFGILVDNLGT